MAKRIENTPAADGNKPRLSGIGGIGGRICLLVIALTALFSLALTCCAYRKYREAMLTGYSESAASVARTVASLVDGDAMTEELKNGAAGPYRKRVLRYIEKISNSTRVSHIYVFGPLADGKYPYYAESNSDHAVGIQVPASGFPPEMAEASAGFATRTGLHAAFEGRQFTAGQMLSAYYPILDSAGQVAGVVGADAGADRPLKEAQLFGVRAGLGGLAATGLMAAAIFIYTRRRLTKPLGVLTSAAEKLAAGETDQMPALPESGGELGLLGAHINRTADAVDSLTPGLGRAINKSPESVRFEKPPVPLGGKFRRLADGLGKALTAMDNVDALVYVVDPDTHRLIYYNRRIERAHSLSHARPSDLVCWKLFGDTLEKPCLDCKLPELLDDIESFPAIEWERFEARTRTWFRIRNSIVRWVDGRTVLFCEAQDITRNKAVEERERRQERELADAAQAAREARRAKAAFLANVSHEIRTPMNGIIGFAELAMDDPGLSQGNRQHLEKIRYSAEGLLSIINDILDYSRIEAGRVEVDRMPFVLGGVIDRCRKEIEPKTAEKNLEACFYVEPFVRKTLVGDAKKLRRVLMNLLSNAVKFTSKGVVKLSCTVERAEGPGMALRFEVSDSGIGMTKDQLEKVFDAFSQADEGSTRKYGGTGLGLAITRRFVELMGGDLNVVSTPGIGSKFSFTLNFGTAGEEAALAADAGNAESESVVRPHFSGDVLVCEDNDINQEVIREHLERLGLSVTMTENGKRGVEAVRQRRDLQRPFDLILMDIHMPVMGGVEAASEIRKDGCQTPIVALTANVLLDDSANYRRAGMNDCLGKPFHAAELWSCLRRHLTGENVAGNGDAPAGDSESSTESSAQPSTHSATSARLPAVQTGDAVDIDEGLKNAAGNRDLYRRLLRNFMQDNRGRVEELIEAAAAGDRPRARRMAHTLKTTSGMIGAFALAAAAGEIETMLANGAGAAVLPAGKLRRLGAELERVFAELAVLTAKQGEPPQEVSVDGIPFDAARARAFLDELEPLLVSGDGEALSFCGEAASLFLACGDSGRELAERIGEYDFEAALGVVGRLRGWLEAGSVEAKK